MVNKLHTTGVQNYNEDYLGCRENHNWHWLTDWKITRGPGQRILQFERLKQCSNCKTMCHRKYDGETGRVIPNTTRYTYPDGYLSDRKNPIDTGSARLEMLRRAGIE